jgi:molecular chaperone GrpE
VSDRAPDEPRVPSSEVDTEPEGAVAAETPDGADGVSGAEPSLGEPEVTITVEDLVADLETVVGERDSYLDALRRLQADFENYRKAVAKREIEARERANEGLVSELLPILDACDGAVDNGVTDVLPVRTSLLDSLTKQGLERIEEAGAPFDPELHEAVMHEPADDQSGPAVSKVLRVGYRWKGRVIRPAMVQVRG